MTDRLRPAHLPFMNCFLRRAGLLPALAGLVAGCGDSGQPSAVVPYDWELIVAFDSAGPREDSLTFHWRAGDYPLQLWVDTTDGLPGHMQHGVNLWRSALAGFGYDAQLTADSTAADVIVRLSSAPLPGPSTARMQLHAVPTDFCTGVTEIDSLPDRHTLPIPLHILIHPEFGNTLTPELTQCLAIVAAHELGHSLGLFMHSADSTDLMYAAPQVAAPSARDIATVRALYQAPADLVPVRQ